MLFTGPASGERGKPHMAPEVVSQVRQVGAPAAYRVEFFLIYMTMSLAGFKMSWTGPSQSPGGSGLAGAPRCETDAANSGGRTGVHATPMSDGVHFRGSNLCIVPEFSIVGTSGSAAYAIQWSQMISNIT